VFQPVSRAAAQRTVLAQHNGDKQAAIARTRSNRSAKRSVERADKAEAGTLSDISVPHRAGPHDFA
jgi:hypothetical protein